VTHPQVRQTLTRASDLRHTSNKVWNRRGGLSVVDVQRRATMSGENTRGQMPGPGQSGRLPGSAQPGHPKPAPADADKVGGPAAETSTEKAKRQAETTGGQQGARPQPEAETKPSGK
jgi:hypothetical protein